MIIIAQVKTRAIMAATILLKPTNIARPKFPKILGGRESLATAQVPSQVWTAKARKNKDVRILFIGLLKNTDH